MPRAGKRILHKGRNRRFTNPEELEEERKREEKKRQWRATHGGESTSEEDEAAGGDENKSDESGSESESESDSEEEVQRKAKGVESLIEIENPNRVQKKTKKLSKLNESLADTSSSRPELSRREREEVEKQKAAAHYQRLHAEGKTEEARADLARLAIVKQQREEAAKKREEEKKPRRRSGRPLQYKCPSCFVFGKNRSAPVLCSNSTSYILWDLKSQLRRMRGEVINSLDYAHSKLDVGNRKLQDQRKVIESVQKLMEDIQSENESLKETISSLQVKLEDVEQYAKMGNFSAPNSAKIVPTESPGKTFEFVHDIGKVLGTTVTAEMLDICNRNRKPQDLSESPEKEAAQQAKKAAVNKAIGKRT